MAMDQSKKVEGYSTTIYKKNSLLMNKETIYVLEMYTRVKKI